MVSRSVPTLTHGRVLTEDAAEAGSGRLLVVFHGYAQSADDALDAARRIPGVPARWPVVSIQGLHRFYARDERVVASWMTRQDRDEAISDNVAYVDRVVADEIERLGQAARRPVGSDARRPVRSLDRRRLVFLGFSQGASMAYRAAVLGRQRAAGVIALAGDVPPELKTMTTWLQPWPPVLIGVGDRESWYTPDQVSADAGFFESRGVGVEVCRFDGGHEWTDEFRAVAGRWLDALA